jgi:hypothetical protein
VDSMHLQQAGVMGGGSHSVTGRLEVEEGTGGATSAHTATRASCVAPLSAPLKSAGSGLEQATHSAHNHTQKLAQPPRTMSSREEM